MCSHLCVQLAYVLFLEDFVAGRFGDLQATISLKGKERQKDTFCGVVNREPGVCDL